MKDIILFPMGNFKMQCNPLKNDCYFELWFHEKIINNRNKYKN